MRKLKLLLAACALFVGAGTSWAQGWTASEVGAGDFYLYNVGAQGFMVGANNWGTRAGVDATGGIPVTLAGSNTYTISTAPTYNGKFLGSNGYVDGSSYAWTFEPVAGQENVYKLKTGSDYLFADAAAEVNLLAKTTTVGADPGTNMAYWRLVSKTDLFADLAKATPESPVWASSLINNPGFGRNINNGSNDNGKGWGWDVAASNQNMSGGTNENRCAEHWRSTFTVKQTISSLPNGIYKLRVQAALTDYNNAYDGTDYPVVYIKSGDKEGTASFNSMDESDRGTNMSTLSNSFASGKYFTDFAQVEVSNGEIEIGVRGTRTDTWCIYDNFQLQMSDPYVSVAATTLPSAGGALEAGKWYKFTVASDGKYGFSPITNIVYTTNGEQLSSTGTGSALEEEMELTAGTVYYVKSTVAQTLTITPKTFTYNVGTATADIAYVQAGNTVTISYVDLATNNPDADVAFSLSGVTFGGNAVTCTPTANGFTFTVPSVTANTDYTLSIPASAIGYAEGDLYNEAQNITLKTPAVFDGTYYLYSPIAQRFLARGSAYGTAAVADKYGIPFNLVVDASGNSTLTFLDNEQGFFGDNWCWTDNSAQSYKIEPATEGDYTGYTLKRINADSNNKVYVYLKEDGDKYRVAANAIIDDNITDWAQTVWQMKSTAERNATVNAYATDNYQNIIDAASLSTTSADFISYLTTNYAGKDYTDKVGTAKFNSAAGDWTYTGVRTNQSGQPAYGVNYVESWLNTGTWSQTISGLPEGIYKVTVNGFERRANNATAYALGEAGYANVVSSYMNVNGEQVQFKSWYDEVVKDGNNYDPNNVSQAVTAFNNDKYKNTVYAYVDNSGELTISVTKPSYIWDCWLLWNNVTLTYYTDQVDAEEVTALLATATEYLAKPMLATLKTAISDAKTALEGNSTIANYNALRTAIDNSQTSVDSYEHMKTYYLDPLADVLENTNVYTTAAYNGVYADYLTAYNNGSIANADANALTWNGGTNGTRAIDNLLMPSWNIGGTTFYQNTWSTEGNNDGSNFKTPFFEYWTGDGNVLAARDLVATQTGLTANGVYKVEAWIRVRQSNAGDKIANGVTMQVGSGNAIDVSAGSQIGDSKLYIGEYEAFGKADAEGNLTITMSVAENSNISWLAFKNVKYTAITTATSSEIEAYNTALAAAEAKVIGFEDGEYAPYNNVAAMATLASVKAQNIDTEYAEQSVVTAATTALTGATWTANDGEVNAIYWKTNYTAEDKAGDGYVHPVGWTNTGYNTRIMCAANDATDNPAMTTIGTAVFAKFNTTYGETAGYTMPLKAGKIYKITFKHCGWGNNPTTNIVLTDPESNTIALAPGFRAATSDGNTDAEHWYDYTGYFVSTTAGDYVIAFNKVDGGQQQIAWADMQLVSATELEFADGTVPTYAPGTYPSVKIARTLTADRWATAVYPFAVSGVDNIALLSSYDKDNGALGFSTAAASGANVPFLMKSTAGVSEISLSNVEVAAAAATDEVQNEASLKGVYSSTAITNEAKNYVLSNNTIYAVGTAGATIAPYRAYIQIAQDGPAARLSFFVDGEETTGIEGITVESQNAEALYNLNGQRVNASAKGIIVKNGKKFINK